LEGNDNITIVDIDEVVVNGGDNTGTDGKWAKCVSIVEEC
jgi:hypothetical protein